MADLPSASPACPRCSRLWWQAGAAAVATGALLGLIAAWVAAHAGGRETGGLIAFCFAAMVLPMLVGPVLLGRADWPGFLRWACATDTAGVALIVATAVGGATTWVVGLRLYVVLACFACMQAGLVWAMGRWTKRTGVAAAAATLLAVVACTSLLWGHLPLRLTRQGAPADSAIMAVVRYADPLLAANDAVNPPTSFSWSHRPLMYGRYSVVGESRTWLLPSWWAAGLIYLLAAAVFVAAGLPRRATKDHEKA
ncbi:MAG: hypothetical protein BIFFINMI_03975 [Phycisphaerae bacterium]|nr:hypothetical protein [Phycisphaerae bacterium]